MAHNETVMQLPEAGSDDSDPDVLLAEHTKGGDGAFSGQELEDYGYAGPGLHVQELAIATKRAVDLHESDLERTFPAMSGSEQNAHVATPVEDAQEALSLAYSQAVEASQPLHAQNDGMTETSRALKEYLPVRDTDATAPSPAVVIESEAPTEPIRFSVREASVALAGINQSMAEALHTGNVAEQDVLMGASNWIMQNTEIPGDSVDVVPPEEQMDQAA